MCRPASEGQAGVLREGAKTLVLRRAKMNALRLFFLVLFFFWFFLRVRRPASPAVRALLQIQDLFVAQLPVIHSAWVPRPCAGARFRTLISCGTRPVLPRLRRRLRSGFPRRSRGTGSRVRCAALPCRAQRGRRPTSHHAFHRAWHQLLCPRINHAHYLSPRGIVKPPRCKDFCHLLAELRVAFQRRFHILADRRAYLSCKGVPCEAAPRPARSRL